MQRLIRAEMVTQGVSAEDMAARLDVGRSTFYGYLREGKSIELGTVQRLCAALDVRLVCKLEPTTT
jgi:transcriptional regulator with XRE-family HTH domain